MKESCSSIIIYIIYKVCVSYYFFPNLFYVCIATVQYNTMSVFILKCDFCDTVYRYHWYWYQVPWYDHMAMTILFSTLKLFIELLRVLKRKTKKSISVPANFLKITLRTYIRTITGQKNIILLKSVKTSSTTLQNVEV